MPLLAVLPFLLTACAASIVADPPPPPASLTAPCTRPVPLPERETPQGEAEIYWGRDRSALRACGEQLDGLANWTKATRAARAI